MKNYLYLDLFCDEAITTVPRSLIRNKKNEFNLRQEEGFRRHDFQWNVKRWEEQTRSKIFFLVYQEEQNYFDREAAKKWRMEEERSP